MQHTELPHKHGHENNMNLELITRILDSTDDFQTVADIFKQLSDPSRLRIFWLLCHREECVSNIAAMMNMSNPAVSHHLKNLRDSKLIISSRHGKEVLYRSSDSQLCQLLHLMMEQSMQLSCPKRLEHDANNILNQTIRQASLDSKTEDVISQIHTYLLENIDKKITIEALAKEFAMNTTSLKDAFKAKYGTSIAAHIKAHRMELAARLLTETNLSIAEIASRVGYETQGKFSTSFKAYHGILPSRFRE